MRAVVRSDEAADALTKAGVETVKADLKDRASLDAACAGVEAVVTTANSAKRGGDDTPQSVDDEGNRNLVDAASAAGVRRFVFTSVLGSDPDSPAPFVRGKGRTEQRVRTSGMEWTVLAPNAFLDFWIPAVVAGPALAGQPVTIVGEGRRRHSMIAERDVAAFAVAALENRTAIGQTLVLGGPEAVSWRDIVAAFEQELGRAVPLRTVAPDEGIPGLPAMVNGLAALLDTYDSPIDMQDTVATYGVTLTPLAQWVREFVAR